MTDSVNALTRTTSYAVCEGSVVNASPPPTFSSISTSGGTVGDIDGGYPATITGTNYIFGASVTFGGTLASSVVVVNPTTITCVVPAHATGTVSVVVTTAGGSSAPNTAFRYFSPAELALTGWWRGSYSGAPWAASTSSGTSFMTGALVNGVAPSVGAAVNGITPATLNGTTQYLANPTLLSSVFTAGAGSIVCLFKAAAASASHGAGSEYLDPYLFGDGSNGGLAMTYTTNGVTALLYDGAYKTAIKAQGTGSYALAMMRWDSSNLGMTVSAAAEVTTPCGAFAAGMANTLSMGASYSLAGLYQGDVEEVLCINSKLTSQNFADLRSYSNTRYFPAGAQV